MVAEEYKNPAGVYKVQTFGILHNKVAIDKDKYKKIRDV
jgi:hypothetical protein